MSPLHSCGFDCSIYTRTAMASHAQEYYTPHYPTVQAYNALFYGCFSLLEVTYLRQSRRLDL